MSEDERAEAKAVRCFMDGTDWEVEIGGTSVKLYPTVDTLLEHAGHDLTGCGIVEVEVTLIRWVQKPGARIGTLQ